MKQYYKTLKEAKKAQKLMGYDVRIFDMGKHRKIRRFFVGSLIEGLNFAR